MVKINPQFDDADDDYFAPLLAATYGAPPIRAGFAERLEQQLDAEFAKLHGNQDVSARAEAAPLPANGSTEHLEPAAPVTIIRQSGDNTIVKRSRNWKVLLALAASLATAAFLLTDPPALAATLQFLVTTLKELSFSVTGADPLPVGPPRNIVPSHESAEQSTRGDATTDRKSVRLDRERETHEQHIVLGSQSRKRNAEANEQSLHRQEKQSRHSLATLPDWKPSDAPMSGDELTRQIDKLLTAQWQAEGITPAQPASDPELMRRLYLDLTGRIPTVSEAQQYLSDTMPDRRVRLVDHLLQHHDHATYLADVWHRILLPDVDLSRLGGTAKFDAWLAERFEANTPYDQIVRELLLAHGRVTENGPLLFYAAVKLSPEELAARVSRTFLGVRMDCAQCHDHPFEQISQHDFWGLAAYFARISRPRGKMEATSPVLQVRDNDDGEVTLPGTAEVVDPWLPQTEGDRQQSEGQSRREVLASWLTSPNNAHFSRAIVNRVWAGLFGRGLVEPVDDMRFENQAPATDLLDVLSRDFSASGFDLRRLYHSIVLTKAYQLSSRSADSDPARSAHFAQMNMKSFTAEQLYDCISVATQMAQLDAESEQGLARLDDTSRSAFVTTFRSEAASPTEYHAGIPQALALMHGTLIHNATSITSGRLLKSLQAPFFSDAQRVDTLYLATLSRYPEPSERETALVLVHAAASDSERQQILGDMLWALLNSAEFTFNH